MENKIRITERILSYIEKHNKHVTHFEIIPKINSIWSVKRIISYPNVCRNQPLIELFNEKGEWLRLPLNLL